MAREIKKTTDATELYNLLNSNGIILTHAQEYNISLSTVSSAMLFEIEGISFPINSEPNALINAVKMLENEMPKFGKKNYLCAADLVQLTLGGGKIIPEKYDIRHNEMINIETYLKFAQRLTSKTVGYLRGEIEGSLNTDQLVSDINKKFKFLSTIINNGKITKTSNIAAIANAILK